MGLLFQKKLALFQLILLTCRGFAPTSGSTNSALRALLVSFFCRKACSFSCKKLAGIGAKAPIPVYNNRRCAPIVGVKRKLRFLQKLAAFAEKSLQLFCGARSRDSCFFLLGPPGGGPYRGLMPPRADLIRGQSPLISGT